ncbi:hypothetical protein ADL29_15955 [Streptomyces chattanoogensis]|uniref:Uncharacterized protein n=1 Tax=Streptomyces chattanoogensis TaxID=66876 RepID=A0A0N1JY95_9ACTN|nr:hypothetical protein ADL29_15955 [Streptomyces chattanoogensis]
MSAAVWPRLRWWAEEAWNRHVRHRELYRQLDRMRADLKARTAWMDDLTEEELAEMLRVSPSASMPYRRRRRRSAAMPRTIGVGRGWREGALPVRRVDAGGRCGGAVRR